MGPTGGHRFVAKGGSAMQLRLGLTARATTDLDLLFRGNARAWLDHFDGALLEGAWNGFDAHRKNEPEEIKVPGMYFRPQRFDVSFNTPAKRSRPFESSWPSTGCRVRVTMT